MNEMMRRVRVWARDESGGSLVEYMMLASLIAVVCVAAVTLLGRSVRTKLDAPSKALQ